MAYHFPELRQQAQLVAPSSPPPFPLPPPFSITPFDFSCNKQSSPWGVHWTMRPMRTDKPKRSEVKLGALGGCFGGWSWVHLQLINWHMDIFMQPLKFCAQIFYTPRGTQEGHRGIQRGHSSWNVALMKPYSNEAARLRIMAMPNGFGMSAAHKFSS